MPSTYREQAADPQFHRWVECSWSVRATESVPAFPVRPDGCLDIIYSPEGGLRAVGAMTVEQLHSFASGVQMVGVRFRPGMAGLFLGSAPAELTDHTVALDDLWGRPARELERRLGDASSPQAHLRAILQSLSAPRPLNPVQRAIEAIAAARGFVDLDNIAAHAGLSPRQFRRRCLEESGLTPKHLCRVLRFRYACRLAEESPRPQWSDIALQAGYFDQAHLIRDFREFTRQTPMAVFSNTGPAQFS